MKEHLRTVITVFIRRRLDESGASGIVLGVSGGIDSALTLKLCCEAAGGRKVRAIYMPYGHFDSSERERTEGFVRSLGASFDMIDISPLVDVARKFAAQDRKILGNVMARTRMLLLYTIANSGNLLVAGTSNKSELLTGYFTKYGDGASDFCPIGDLYKTEVRELAREMDIPVYFLEKVPTAGLWKGQTDEGELGISYEELDVLLKLFEEGYSPASISAREGFQPEKVEKVWSLLDRSRHKRRLPLIPKVGIRTVGTDWRE